MNKDKIDKKILDLMKDEHFIEWKVFPNEKITAYWKQYLEDNPQEKFIFEQADQTFPNVKISSNRVSAAKKKAVIDKINKSIYQKRNKTVIRTIVLGVAAILIGAIVLITLPKTNIEIEHEDIIVGNEIGALDIQLTSNNKTTSFQNNIDIEVDVLGEIKIKSADEESSELIADKSSLNTLSVPFGKRSTILLADGSRVWLNSGTILEFPSSFSSQSRDISLKAGEIYIEVAEDSAKPFFVKTSDFKIRVYGTKFSVSDYEYENSSVVLAEGSISLMKEGMDELMVEPSELVELSSDNKFVKQKVDINNYLSWKSGYLLFNNSPITEVLQQLERYYNLSFDFENEKSFKENSCKGKIVLSENLDNVLSTLSLLTGTEYKREENKIYITPKKRK